MFETVQTGQRGRAAARPGDALRDGPRGVARSRLAGGDARALTKIPGVGPKSADRLVLELRDKVGPAPGAGSGAAAAQAPGDWRAPVTEALVGLGWNAKQAESAVEKVAAGEGAAAGDIAAYLRLALRELRR
jgi:Holliday junction DNA helicase RuvA